MNAKIFRLAAVVLLSSMTLGCQAGGDFKRLEIGGDERKNGIFDASIAFDDEGTGWLAYSKISIPKFVETHLAKSTDSGKTWVYVDALNHSEEATIEENGKTVKGAWREETPVLLHDPTDRPARRWKLITNRYFVADPYKPLDRRMSDGSINLRHAPHPSGPWSEARCIVGDAQSCSLNLRKAHPSLAEIKLNTEPGALIEDEVIYMSLDAGSTDSGLGEWENYRVVLLASDDHGTSWRYVDTLLDHDDAQAFGYSVFTGTSLVRDGGEIYLLATPSGGLDKKHQGHDGVMVMKVDKLSRAQLERDKDGLPRVIKRIEMTRQSGGLADYHESNRAGGILMPQISLRNFPAIFQIFETGEGIRD